MLTKNQSILRLAQALRIAAQDDKIRSKHLLAK